MTIYGEQGRTTAFLTECKHRFMVSGVEPYEAQNQYWCALEWGKRCYNLTYSDLCREELGEITTLVASKVELEEY